MKEKVVADIDLKDPKMYEIGFLLSPFVPEADKQDTIGKLIIAQIEAAGGTVTGQTPATMRKLAYTMSKSVNHKRTNFVDAYFGAVRFTITPDKVAGVQKAIDSEDNIIRTLVIEVSSRSQVVSTSARTENGSPDTAEPVATDTLDVVVDNEQIDMEIEELLTPKAS